jgi:hypothetical protein
MDCLFLDGKYCSAAAIELDPDTGCKTYQPNDDIDIEGWDEDEDLEDWEEMDDEEEEDLWIDEDEENLLDLDLDDEDDGF